VARELEQRTAQNVRMHSRSLFRAVVACTVSCSVGLSACSAPAVPQPSATTELRLPALISDHMVLQRGDEARLHGWAAPGSTVEVEASWLKESRDCRVDASGAWKLELPAREAGGPHVLRIRCGGEVREISDVLVGDVWVCSGQSNMEMTLGELARGGASAASAASAAADQAASNRPGLRLFDVENAISPREESDCRGSWKVCSPEAVDSFSAVGYYFGARVNEHTHAPIGLIGSNWGGTRVEAWTSTRGLAKVTAERANLEYVRDEREQPERSAELRRRKTAEWWDALARADGGSGAQAWHAREVDTSAWDSLSVPATWGGAYGSFDGVIWLRREFDLPAGLAGFDLSLELGAIDDMDTVWLDGERIGGMEESGRWQDPRRYSIPARLATPGTHALAVRVLDTGGAAGISAAPEALRLAARDGIGGPHVALAGTWRARKGVELSQLERFPSSSGFSEWHPTALYNAMIAPLTASSIRGVIWYQGESNRSNAERYADLMRGLVRDWRKRWGDSRLPFYWVQIAPYRYGDLPGATARVREAQQDATDLAFTGMAVTLDVGNPDDIHPHDKRPVGERLARLALSQLYGAAELETSGPRYERVTRAGRTLRVAFTHADGLRASSADGPYEIAGADRVFHPAWVRVDGATLVAESPRVNEPVAFRYAWCDECAGTLFNAAGLPAEPFRTERWD
jgi:sialate O-acetylesterase